jgi:glucokinase
MTHAIVGEIKHGSDSVVKQELGEEGVELRSGQIAAAIQAGDALVGEIVRESAEYLAYGLASIINFYNPQKIILGGGVIEAMDVIYDHATARARHVALPAAARVVEFSRTGLGDNAGAVGAATLGADASR